MITKKILDIYDKYEGDFGLLDEPWASKKDREIVSSFQSQLLSEYIEQLHFVKIENISNKMRTQTLERIRELEKYIDKDVIKILKSRID